MTVLDCEYNDEFGGILAKLLIDGNIFLVRATAGRY